MIWWDYCSQSGSCSCSTPSSCKMKSGNILIYAVKYVHIELFVKSEWISPPKEPVETFVFHKNQSTSADPACRITTDLNSFPHFAKWLMTVICASHLCVCVPLLWFPRSGMCRDLADRAPHICWILGAITAGQTSNTVTHFTSLSLRGDQQLPHAPDDKWPFHRPTDGPADKTPGFPLPVSVWPPLAMLRNKVGGIQWFQPTRICLLLLLLLFIMCLLMVEINRNDCLVTVRLWRMDKNKSVNRDQISKFNTVVKTFDRV